VSLWKCSSFAPNACHGWLSGARVPFGELSASPPGVSLIGGKAGPSTAPWGLRSLRVPQGLRFAATGSTLRYDGMTRGRGVEHRATSVEERAARRQEASSCPTRKSPSAGKQVPLPRRRDRDDPPTLKLRRAGKQQGVNPCATQEKAGPSTRPARTRGTGSPRRCSGSPRCYDGMTA